MQLLDAVVDERGDYPLLALLWKTLGRWKGYLGCASGPRVLSSTLRNQRRILAKNVEESFVEYLEERRGHRNGIETRFKRRVTERSVLAEYGE